MRPSHRITIHWRQEGRTITHDVPEGTTSSTASKSRVTHFLLLQKRMLHGVRRSRAERQPRPARSHGSVAGAEGQGLRPLCVARAIGPWRLKPRMRMRCTSSSSDATSAKARHRSHPLEEEEHAGIDLHRAAREAGLTQAIWSVLSRGPLSGRCRWPGTDAPLRAPVIHRKQRPHGDLVTNADLAAERIVLELLAEQTLRLPCWRRKAGSRSAGRPEVVC